MPEALSFVVLGLWARHKGYPQLVGCLGPLLAYLAVAILVGVAAATGRAMPTFGEALVPYVSGFAVATLVVAVLPRRENDDAAVLAQIPLKRVVLGSTEPQRPDDPPPA